MSVRMGPLAALPEAGEADSPTAVATPDRSFCVATERSEKLGVLDLEGSTAPTEAEVQRRCKRPEGQWCRRPRRKFQDLPSLVQLTVIFAAVLASLIGIGFALYMIDTKVIFYWVYFK